MCVCVCLRWERRRWSSGRISGPKGKKKSQKRKRVGGSLVGTSPAPFAHRLCSKTAAASAVLGTSGCPFRWARDRHTHTQREEKHLGKIFPFLTGRSGASASFFFSFLFYYFFPWKKKGTCCRLNLSGLLSPSRHIVVTTSHRCFDLLHHHYHNHR